MRNFYELIETLLIKPMKIQQSTSFLETMETSLRKRQLNIKNRLWKNGNTNMQQVMQAKPGSKIPKAEQQCKHADAGTTWTSHNLAHMKETHCKGSNHLDLYNTDIKNIAIHYLINDVSSEYQNYMLNLKQSLRYEIDDTSCPAAPLFTANDISIQQVAMDVLRNKTEWVAVVNLNTKAENGYLQNELPHCNVRDYLIGASVKVKAYVDNDRCCDGLRDVKLCQAKPGCKDKLVALKDIRNSDYSKDVAVTGTQYTVTNSQLHRRRLLQSGRRSS
jgi:hypothetical protein